MAAIDANALQNIGGAGDAAKKSATPIDLTTAQPPKRKADDAGLLAENDDGGYTSDDEVCYITDTPNQIRGKINRFIDNGGMKVGEFLKAIDVSSVSYYSFMKKNGNKGNQSNTYINAMRFFQKRAARGEPFPKKRKAAAPKPAEGSTAGGAGARGGGDAPPAAAWRAVTLPGADRDAVPVFDTCDEVRRKINAHLRKPGVTQAAFLRELLEQFSAEGKPSSLQSAQLARFRGQKGPMTGNTSGIYYAAYVYFERERVAANKPKSAHRRDMEAAWGREGGVDVNTNLNNVSYISTGPVYMDRLGRVSGRDWSS